ncbi:putative membrane protein YedE/YeeE [Paenibacillus sp. V4I9]|nr:putative membrane protein YedE/YeeE [Paenibacillus sp. V4I9]
MILGLIIGFIYMILSLVILMVTYSYLREFEEMIKNIYLYYLPIIILLISILLKQYRSSITILISIITEAYLFYLWEEMWNNTTWTF